MNNTFSFERFVKVLKYDLKMRVPAIRTMFLVLLVMPHALHFIMAYGETFPAGQRVDLYAVMTTCLIFFAPFGIYSALREKHGKASFLMLPASVLEKFASMFVITLVAVPVLFIISCVAIDYVLVLLLKMYYNSFISVDPMILLRGAMGVFSIVGAAVLGNAIFKGKAAFKTILCLLVLLVLWGVLLSDLLFDIDNIFPNGDIDASAVQAKTEMIVNISATVYTAVGVLFYILTFWRIKKMQIS